MLPRRVSARERGHDLQEGHDMQPFEIPPSASSCCRRCGRSFPLDEFGWKSKKQGRRYSICRDCVNDANRESYQRNVDQRRMDKREQRARQKQERPLTRREELAALPRAPSGMKRCPICMEVKPLDAFPWQNKEQNRRQGYCTPCWLQRMKDERAALAAGALSDLKRRVAQRGRARYAGWTAEERQTQLERQREWRRANPEKVRNRWQRRRARELGAAVVLPVTVEEIISRDGMVCYLCGKELGDDALSLDHVIPLRRGGTHTPENLRIACRSCNSRKGSLLLDEFYARYPMYRRSA
jgi:5-methylcytosine-specific restriction endonuclease McrA